ncbi:NAD(P)-binding protein [Roridomyces roridus]|uniref:NAD(P)-binding protein n=1 Tax=Roridomyces roridus TaxID=1738132 RepID=A0AAD7B1C7_9AGAR|nr:NAD(P)-binding protein [Roridomyces roridus]
MKSVLITGCTPGGIGHALAKEYHTQGLRVFATARRQEVLADLAAQGVETLQLDVCDSESVKTAREAVAAITGGKLDILVNNAPRNGRHQRIYEVNLFGAMRMVKEFAPLLIESGDGRIVNIGSVLGIVPHPFYNSAYNSSKAALHAYGNTLRLELAPFNVQVTTVITGAVQTNIWVSGAPVPLKPNSIYAPIADIIAKLFTREQVEKMMTAEAYAKYVVSQTLKRSVRAWLWQGSGSWIVWSIDTFWHRTGFDAVCWKAAGLHKLKAHVAENKKHN